jgi:predicted enzyme related to lactoylglutathione lyase
MSFADLFGGEQLSGQWPASVGSDPSFLVFSPRYCIDQSTRTKSKTRSKTARPNRERNRRRNKMKIKVTSVYVDDQERALRFYTEVLGFVKKTDFSQGPYRWLTVASPEEPDGTELQLALNNNPAAKTYQQAIFQQSQPAAMFFTDDVQADYERMKASGAEFTMPPTDVTASKIAMLNDTCGNLIQITQLKRW